MDPKERLAMWDRRFDAARSFYGDEPNAFLAESAVRFAVGSHVVCLGAGQGRNALWLARRGFRVTAVDGSRVAIDQLQEQAKADGLDLELICADLATWEPPGHDISVSTFLHLPPPLRTAVFRRAFGRISEKGLFVGEFFATTQLQRGTGGPKNPAMLYTAADLRADLPDADFELLEETTVELAEGEGHVGTADVVRLLAWRTPRSRAPFERC